MRYEKGQRERTRHHIVKVASRRFRKDGIDAVGISQLMADAGLTHGGFYNHFASKEALAAEAITSSMAETLAWLKKKAKSNGDGLDSVVNAYLDPRHVNRPEDGCSLAALLSEAAHAKGLVRSAAIAERDRFAALIASCLDHELGEDRKWVTATAILSTMIGTIQLARLSESPGEVSSILEAGKSSISELRKQTAKPADGQS